MFNEQELDEKNTDTRRVRAVIGGEKILVDRVFAKNLFQILHVLDEYGRFLLCAVEKNVVFVAIFLAVRCHKIIDEQLICGKPECVCNLYQRF